MSITLREVLWLASTAIMGGMLGVVVHQFLRRRGWIHDDQANPLTAANEATEGLGGHVDAVGANEPKTPDSPDDNEPAAGKLFDPSELMQGARSALSDPLTGLASRLMLEDHLAAAALRAEARQRRLALLSIDLDGFKAINDTFGRSAGDSVLREVATRVLALARSSDTIARIGADEFLMLMDGDPDSAAAALVADRIRQAVLRPHQLPHQLPNRRLQVSCSIGIVLYPDHGPRARLIARADAAMLAAKHAGGNMHCFFDPGMEEGEQDIIGLQRELRRALETRTGLELHYQPKVDGRTGQVTGLEALVRWHHPERGLVGPSVFVPIAERFGLIGGLGQWVTDEACRQMRAWHELGLGLRVAVNLSAHQLRQSDLVECVQEALQRHAVPADHLTLEITESAAMEDPQATLRLFERLAQLGVHLAIDDLGTGHSSLSYLGKLPASQLKIDRSFMQDLDRDADARATVRAITKLSHALGLGIVAEGVETQAQLDILRRLGCDELQGFLLAKPMPARHMQAWLEGNGSRIRPGNFADGDFQADDADPQAPPGKRGRATDPPA